jgi:hypothetical protein
MLWESRASGPSKVSRKKRTIFFMNAVIIPSQFNPLIWKKTEN